MNISVVIPVINEQDLIASAIERAWLCGADEVIVVDGGSEDRTLEIAAESKCKLIHSAAGRGVQQNEGATAATGDVVLFIHADTWLDEGGCEQIRNHFADTDLFCGAFEQTILHSSTIYRWIESGNATRVKWRGLFYGDQGIFVSKSLLEKIGGIPTVALMEDFILSRKMKSFPQALLPGKIHVDARRWENRGPIRQTVKNWLIVGLFYLGVGPERLAAIYRRHDQKK